jgi:hypothetical protein
VAQKMRGPTAATVSAMLACIAATSPVTTGSLQQDGCFFFPGGSHATPAGGGVGASSGKSRSARWAHALPTNVRRPGAAFAARASHARRSCASVASADANGTWQVTSVPGSVVVVLVVTVFVVVGAFVDVLVAVDVDVVVCASARVASASPMAASSRAQRRALTEPRTRSDTS